MNEKDQKVANVAISIAVAIVVVPIYIFLHEAGHALVSIFCGAKVTGFSIVGAFSTSVGGNYTIWTHSLLYLAGVLLPLLVSICFLFFYKKDSGRKLYHIFVFYITIISAGSLLAWIFVPILYILGNASPSDDISQLLEISKIQPLLVTVCALAVEILYIMWMWKKKVIQNWWKILQGK